MNWKCSLPNCLLLGALFRSAMELVSWYFFNSKYSDFLETLMLSSSSLIFTTENPALYRHTTLTLVSALMPPIVSRSFRVSKIERSQDRALSHVLGRLARTEFVTFEWRGEGAASIRMYSPTYEEILDISLFFTLILTFLYCRLNYGQYWRWSHLSALFWLYSHPILNSRFWSTGPGTCLRQ